MQRLIFAETDLVEHEFGELERPLRKPKVGFRAEAKGVIQPDSSIRILPADDMGGFELAGTFMALPTVGGAPSPRPDELRM